MNYRLRLRALVAVRVDVRHNVVAELLLVRLGGVVVDVVTVRLELRYLLVGYVETRLLLGSREGNPELSERAELHVL